MPLSKIFKRKYFWNDCFYTGRHVLDPRQETEIVVEVAVKYIKKYNLGSILDLGTGSGCVIISIKSELDELDCSRYISRDCRRLDSNEGDFSQNYKERDAARYQDCIAVDLKHCSGFSDTKDSVCESVEFDIGDVVNSGCFVDLGGDGPAPSHSGSLDEKGAVDKIDRVNLEEKSNKSSLESTKVNFKGSGEAEDNIDNANKIGVETKFNINEVKPERRKIRYTAVDISRKALKIAKYNELKILGNKAKIESSTCRCQICSQKKEAICGENKPNINNCIEFLHSDWFESLNPKNKYSMIISNPPYICPNEKRHPSIKYDPACALYADEKGLKNYRIISNQASDFLYDGGFLIFEVGAGQSYDIKNINTSLKYIETIYDYNGIDRCVVFKKQTA